MEEIAREYGEITMEGFRRDYPEMACELKSSLERIAALEAENAELLESLFWYFGQSRYSVRPARGGYYLFDNQASRYPVRIDPDSSGSTWMRWQDAIDAAREGKS